MENDLLEILTQRVRVFSEVQVASAFCHAERGMTEELLFSLESQGLVERQTVLARPVLRLEAPVIVWRPNEKAPEFGPAAYKLKTRWRVPAAPTDIVQATSRATKFFGGYLGGRWPRTSEITHDLNLAELFLWHRERRPAEAHAWVPEAQLYAEGKGLGQRLPDAIIRAGGVDLRVVEFGGSYGKQKLQTFHAQMNSLPYEIW